MLFQSLESRTHLSVSPEPGASLATAHNLGSVVNVRAVTETLSPSDNVDTYRVTLSARGNFNVALSGLAADAKLELLNKSGAVLATGNKAGLAVEKISRELNKGNYFLRVSAADASTGYKLRLQADLNWGTVADADGTAAGLVWADGSTRPFNKAKQTWVVVHGWTSTPQSLADVSDAIDGQTTKDQVLVLDWSQGASGGNLEALFRVPPTADWAAKKLKSWGLPGARVNLVGHSFGGYLVGKMAEGFAGGVNRIVALDPATNPFDDVDYAAHSKFSFGFIGSSFSTPEHAQTADASFRMNVGDYDSIFTHMAVPRLYAAMIASNNREMPDRISKLFALDRMSPTITQPWRELDGYEGTLTGKAGIDGYAPSVLTYRNRTTGATVTVKP